MRDPSAEQPAKPAPGDAGRPGTRLGLLDRLTRRAPRLRGTVDMGRAMAREWNDDRVSGLGAEVAFFAVLSLFPALLAVTAMLGFLEPIAGADVAQEARDSVVEWIEDLLGGQAEGLVAATESLFDRPSPGLLTFGLLATVWTASRVFAALIRALDVVYDLEERRTWLGVRGTALGLAVGSLVVGAVVLSMVVVGPLLGRGEEVAAEVGAGGAFATFWTWLRPPFLVLVMVLWAATVFHIAPNHRTPWRWDLPGAALTTGLWLAGSAGFRLYLELASEGSNVVFGVLGGALTVMLWLYVMAIAVLVGGELNAILAARHDVPQRPTKGSRSRIAFRRASARVARRWRRREGAASA